MPTLNELEDSISPKRPRNELQLDDQDDSCRRSKEDSVSKGQESVFKIDLPPPKPRVELNENNLLSGFMKEFGLSVAQQVQQRQMAS